MGTDHRGGGATSDPVIVAISGESKWWVRSSNRHAMRAERWNDRFALHQANQAALIARALQSEGK